MPLGPEVCGMCCWLEGVWVISGCVSVVFVRGVVLFLVWFCFIISSSCFFREVTVLVNVTICARKRSITWSIEFRTIRCISCWFMVGGGVVG